MASAVTFQVSPCFRTNFDFKARFQVKAERLGGGGGGGGGSSSTDLPVLSSDGVSVNENGSVLGERKKLGSLLDGGGNGRLKPGVEKNMVKEMVPEEKLEVLWDDGFGNNTVKDYLDTAKDMIMPDGGPPRWFCPVECGRPLKDSPVLLFLPGLDGIGMGLILHHKAMGKVFEVRCLHIPVSDRTPFEGLVKLVEETVRLEHASRPNSPIYLLGDSFGGCLALAVAARNPKIDLVLILINPATSFGRSQLQPLLPTLEAIPNELHVTIPYLLSLVMGEPLQMAMVGIDFKLPPSKKIEKLTGNLTALLPRLSCLADIIPKETLSWKLKLLKSASAYANSRLHAVKAEVLVLASKNDNMLPSQEEALRLKKLIRNCMVRCFDGNGHAFLLEGSMNLLTIIKSTTKYRRSRRHDFTSDFLPPSISEYGRAFDEETGFTRFASCSTMFSTMEDGKIVKGLAGVPDKGPVLLVGYHMLMGLELPCLVEAFLREKKIIIRGIAHPELFWGNSQNRTNDFAHTDSLKAMGALPVSPKHLYKALSANSHVLLYPGGAREALHYKGEQYKLFWPNQQEFVRMAAKFGATIVPFGTVGEDDIVELVLDYNDLMRIPVVNDRIKEDVKGGIKVRDQSQGEVGNQDLFVPGLLPKLPGRFYYLFGKPISLKGREDLVQDKEAANEVYLQVKSEVEQCISYLLKKREEDPYRNVIDRTIYRALYSPLDQFPSFKP